MVAGTLYVYVLIQLFLVSLIDIKHKKISNQWLYINLLVTIALAVFFREEYPLTNQKILYSVAFFVVGFVLYLLRVIGAGDSKYLCSLFLLIPANWCELQLYSLFFSTVMIGGFVFFTSVVKNFDQIMLSLSTRDYSGVVKVLNNRFSYAPVILVSWVITGVLIFGRGYIGY